MFYSKTCWRDDTLRTGTTIHVEGIASFTGAYEDGIIIKIVLG